MRVILIGGGKLVYFLAKQFVAEKHHVILIDRHPTEAAEFSHQLKATVILGDGSNPAVLKEAEIEGADVVLSLTPHDEDNLVACQIAQKLYGVPRTIALINDPAHQAFFEQLGITVAFSATQILASLIKEQTDLGEIENVLAVAAGKINVTEVVLDEASPAVGKTLQALELPPEVLIGCILREEQAIVPRGRSRLQTGDRLFLIGQPEHDEQLLKILKKLTGEEA